MAQYSIATDLNRCVGCLHCCTACKAINDVPIGNYWTKILRIGPNPMREGGTWPDVELYFLPVQCQHCLKPECVAVCPTGASKKQADGTVQIDKEKCIGCQFCVMACPYGVRYLNEAERVVEKCTLCEQRTAQGELPACVAECGGMARWFGDLDKGLASFEGPEQTDGKRAILGQFIKPYSDANVYTLPDVGNGPSFRFILRKWQWRG